ncbi:MAG: hypothetical protein HY301_05545 [Verrucomicrobia bacterium]|nr:hypothetical protein [Verrucomicrobiota bacterium]
MNCPHCQKEQPPNYSPEWCRFCGRDLFPDQISSVESPGINWPIFFAVLLAPAILSLIGLALKVGGLVLIATFGGSLIAGKVCSAMLDERWGMSSVVQWLLAIVLAMLSFLLCFGGCLAGAVITSR